MLKHDFGQLPVIDSDNRPLGMVTFDGILRGVRNFAAKLDSLHVRDVMTGAKSFRPEADLFDLLDELKRTYGVLIVDAAGVLEGIVTSFDSTEYSAPRRKLDAH